MEEKTKKVNSLLKFYYKEGVNINLKRKSLPNFIINGKIIRKNLIGEKFIVIKNADRAPYKIFLEDIELESIIPFDYERKENNHNNKPRSSISKALRYKILKRDRFTCQACGARAPDVELEVDHIIPVSKGGTDDESNLTTLCKACNRGKSNKI